MNLFEAALYSACPCTMYRVMRTRKHIFQASLLCVGILGVKLTNETICLDRKLMLIKVA